MFRNLAIVVMIACGCQATDQQESALRVPTRPTASQINPEQPRTPMHRSRTAVETVPTPAARAASVNGTAILADTVNRRMAAVSRFRQGQNRPLSPEERSIRRRHILESLIDQRLILLNSKKRNALSERRIDREVERVKSNDFHDDAQFQNYLQSRGITAAEYRDEIAEHLAIDIDIAPSHDRIEELFATRFSRPARSRSARITIVTPASEVPSQLAVTRQWPNVATHEIGWVEPTSEHQVVPAAFENTGGTLDRARNILFWTHETKEQVDPAFVEHQETLAHILEREDLQSVRQALIEKLRQEAEISYSQH